MHEAPSLDLSALSVQQHLRIAEPCHPVVGSCPAGRGKLLNHQVVCTARKLNPRP